MATEADIDGLFVGADHTIIYTDSDDPPSDMTGWTIVLDIRKKDISSTILKQVTGVVSGVYSSTPASNFQIVTFILSDDDLAASIFHGDDPKPRYSIKRTNPSAEQPLRFGTLNLTRVTQV